MDRGARDLPDRVRPRLDVLDVEGCEDVDPGLDQLDDILPPLRVARAGGVRVGQLIHEDERGPPGKDRLEVHLGEGDAAVGNLLAGHNGQPRKQRLGFDPAVGLDDTHDGFQPVVAFLLSSPKHGERLAHAGTHSEKHLEPSAPSARLLELKGGQKRVGIRAGIRHGGFRGLAAIALMTERETPISGDAN